MMYHSTRDDGLTAAPSEALLMGIAPDGGLFVPDQLDSIRFPMEKLMSMSAYEISAKVLSLLLPDMGEESLLPLVSRAYEGKFETSDITPLVPVGEHFVLELFRGPTSAFKDVALCALPHLMARARQVTGFSDEIAILTATSGDTGKAALSGFADVPGTRIIVFYPNDGVSAIQKRQMTTQRGKNVAVCAIRGNFDDAQSGVKSIFTRAGSELALPKGVSLSSANSINIGRLAPQLAYYFIAYKSLVERGALAMGERVSFVVPTGNFGDILAGLFAKRLGLPVNRLVCASNENNVLTDFIETGVYDRRREFKKTSSPSMDILVSSNLERLIYMLAGAQRTKAYMDSLKRTGVYSLTPSEHERLVAEFDGGFCDAKGTREAIRRVYESYGYLMDTHTAVAYDVAERYSAAHGGERTVVLSTASPYKFAPEVLAALGEDAGDDEFFAMQRLNELSGVEIPTGLRELAGLEAIHKDVIENERMADYVMGKLMS